MRGVRADPQPKADTMSLRPVSVPVLVGEQHEPARQMDSEPRLGVTWDAFAWRGAPR
jgi:hypothetical protein